MSCVEWDESYDLGISQLDEHHRHLVGLLKSTSDCCLDDNREGTLETVLDELLNTLSLCGA